ncbi:uroporphyrinogen-III synthase, partial [Promicromonospora kroppenstedtii]|uniref:uroporphyrinogen-III synthase n=1 Tax=Promicromonospora kroppenstedtii TaxID=440482 RepID=UPI00146F98BE
PAPVRWAAVGPATKHALAAHGLSVDLVPETATGAGLADTFPTAPGTAPRVLLPLGDLAADTVRAGLVAKGWVVDVVTAYRTVAHEIPPELRRRYDVVVVASGSAARQVAAQLGPQRVVAIGEPSARVAGDVGHTVLGVAEAPTDAALAAAVTEALVRT